MFLHRENELQMREIDHIQCSALFIPPPTKPKFHLKLVYILFGGSGFRI